MSPKEEKECSMIAGNVRGGGKIGVVVDNDEKADRYIQRIKEMVPGALVVMRGQFHGAIAFALKLPGANPSNN